MPTSIAYSSRKPPPGPPHVRSRACGTAQAVPSSTARYTCPADAPWRVATSIRSEEHTSELQSLMRNLYAVLRLQKTNTQLCIINRTHILNLQNEISHGYSYLA